MTRLHGVGPTCALVTKCSRPQSLGGRGQGGRWRSRGARQRRGLSRGFWGERAMNMAFRSPRRRFGAAAKCKSHNQLLTRQRQFSALRLLIVVALVCCLIPAGFVPEQVRGCPIPPQWRTCRRTTSSTSRRSCRPRTSLTRCVAEGGTEGQMRGAGAGERARTV